MPAILHLASLLPEFVSFDSAPTEVGSNNSAATSKVHGFHLEVQICSKFGGTSNMYHRCEGLEMAQVDSHV